MSKHTVRTMYVSANISAKDTDAAKYRLQGSRLPVVKSCLQLMHRALPLLKSRVNTTRLILGLKGRDLHTLLPVDASVIIAAAWQFVLIIHNHRGIPPRMFL